MHSESGVAWFSDRLLMDKPSPFFRTSFAVIFNIAHTNKTWFRTSQIPSAQQKKYLQNFMGQWGILLHTILVGDDKRQVPTMSGWNLKYFTIQRVQDQLQTCWKFGSFLFDKKNGSPLRRVEAKWINKELGTTSHLHQVCEDVLNDLKISSPHHLRFCAKDPRNPFLTKCNLLQQKHMRLFTHVLSAWTVSELFTWFHPYQSMKKLLLELVPSGKLT